MTAGIGALMESAQVNSVPLDLYWHHWERELGPLVKLSALIMDHACSRPVHENQAAGDGG